MPVLLAFQAERIICCLSRYPGGAFAMLLSKGCRTAHLCGYKAHCELTKFEEVKEISM